MTQGTRTSIQGQGWTKAVLGRCVAIGLAVGAGGCYDGLGDVDAAGEQLSPEELEDAAVSEDEPGAQPTSLLTCGPQMTRFPTTTPHNIGYDNASCGTGKCELSCPDVHANSDHHNGIDVFAYTEPGAELVAVADGTVVAVGWASTRSGLRVRLRDDCGWEYYYGHLDASEVNVGDQVKAGQRIGTMGNTGKRADGSGYSVHLHFNVSLDGGYKDGQGGINPFELLKATSPTACGADPSPPSDGGQPTAPEPPPPVPGCGLLLPGQLMAPNDILLSCDGRFQVQLQGDGNIVLRVPEYVGLWHSATHGNSPSGLVMQEDGNLVLYGTNGGAIWHTNTHGNPGAFLVMQDDGNLVIYRGNSPLWNTGTNQ